MENKLLSGIKVIDLTTYVAGPSCTKLLADMGANVVKIESPSGDPMRFSATVFEVPSTIEENPIFELYNANKQGIAVDMKNPKGLEIMHRLLGWADVFVTNTRAQALEKMGMDYESLKKKYPRLIFAHLLGYGEKGPMKDAPGFDSVAFWARSGCLGDLVKEGEYPITSPYAFGDVSTGTALFGGICAALLKQQRTGLGDRVIVSLYGCSIWFSSTLIVSAQECYGAVFPKKREDGVPVAVPYRCSDGEWLMPTILEYERYFSTFCEILDVKFLLDDERYVSMATMMKNKGYLIKTFEAAFAKRTSVELAAAFAAADITCEKVRHFKEVNTDEQAWANDYLHNFTYSNGNNAILARTPIQVASTELPAYNRAPTIGKDNATVLTAIGYSADQIEQLSAANVIK